MARYHNKVSETHTIIHQTTSNHVCHNLSFKKVIFDHRFNVLSNSSFILLRNVACCHASNLTFAASYQNKNQNTNEIANSAELIQYSISIIVAILAAIQLCTEGNHHADHSDAKVNFLFV